MTSHGQVLKPSYKKGGAIQGTQGARGRAVGAARIPERNLNPQSEFPKITNIMALSSFRMKFHILKIDVDDGFGPQDRCR